MEVMDLSSCPCYLNGSGSQGMIPSGKVLGSWWASSRPTFDIQARTWCWFSRGWQGQCRWEATHRWSVSSNFSVTCWHSCMVQMTMRRSSINYKRVPFRWLSVWGLFLLFFTYTAEIHSSSVPVPCNKHINLCLDWSMAKVTTWEIFSPCLLLHSKQAPLLELVSNPLLLLDFFCRNSFELFLTNVAQSFFWTPPTSSTFYKCLVLTWSQKLY